MTTKAGNGLLDMIEAATGWSAFDVGRDFAPEIEAIENEARAPLEAEIERLQKIEAAAIEISRRTYVDEGVVAHVPFDDLYALRQALYGSDEEIVAALAAQEEK